MLMILLMSEKQNITSQINLELEIHIIFVKNVYMQGMN